MTSEKDVKEGRQESCVIWGRAFQAEGKSMCKDPVAGVCLMEQPEARWLEGGGRVMGDEVSVMLHL